MTRGETFWRGVPQAVRRLQKNWDRKGGCRRGGVEKVAAAEIVGKANPKNKGGFLKRKKEEERRRKQKRSWGEFSLRGLVGKGDFLGWLLERKDSCPISCPPSWRELF